MRRVTETHTCPSLFDRTDPPRHRWARALLPGVAMRKAEVEENFCCRTGKGLKALSQKKRSGCTRILLSSYELSSLPEMRASSMVRNKLTVVPKKVIGSMISLNILDLSHTSLQPLPENVGCLKQLVLRWWRYANLSTLTQLKVLRLQNNGETTSERTLGSMVQ